MKKIQKNILKITTIISLFLLISCDDYLSELPDNRAEIDSPEILNEYAKVNGITHKNWHLLTGKSEDIVYRSVI